MDTVTKSLDQLHERLKTAEELVGKHRHQEESLNLQREDKQHDGLWHTASGLGCVFLESQKQIWNAEENKNDREARGTHR
jgi:hypothetical protein